MKKTIKHATVLGSGIMGSQIACHLANIGVQVLLLDIPPKELNEKEQKAAINIHIIINDETQTGGVVLDLPQEASNDEFLYRTAYESSNNFHLSSGAAHELGHVLGLSHTAGARLLTRSF
jgi:2-polyprenyl-6-methoxyphenol hydroxylase-like FAD-dependent oxidoreductase